MTRQICCMLIDECWSSECNHHKARYYSSSNKGNIFLQCTKILKVYLQVISFSAFHHTFFKYQYWKKTWKQHWIVVGKLILGYCFSKLGLSRVQSDLLSWLSAVYVKETLQLLQNRLSQHENDIKIFFKLPLCLHTPWRGCILLSLHEQRSVHSEGNAGKRKFLEDANKMVLTLKQIPISWKMFSERFRSFYLLYQYLTLVSTQLVLLTTVAKCSLERMSNRNVA